MSMTYDIKKACKLTSRGKKEDVCSYFMTVDIETSHNWTKGAKINSWYAWTYQQGCAIFDSVSKKCLAYSETRSVIDLCKNIIDFDTEVSKLNTKGIVFIHKLKFDLTFIRSTLIRMFKEVYDDLEYDDKMTNKSTWLLFKIHNIEFRCSYRLTDMSLYSFTKEMDVEHKKLLGCNDYGVHYTKELLTDDFKHYMRNDVIGLGEALCTLLQLENINLSQLPYTSTGFVRNELKQAFKRNPKAIDDFRKSKPTPYEFLIWRRNYSGGLTIANELYVNKKIEDTIKHRDFVSFYPSLMVTQQFPVSKGRLIWKKDKSKLHDVNVFKEGVSLIKDIVDNNRLVMAKLLVINYKVKQNVMPFLQFSDDHITNIKRISAPKVYSGKLKEYDGAFEVCLTTPEIKMLFDYCTTETIIPLEVYEYKSGRLPKEIIDIVLNYFTLKSKLKYAVKQAKTSKSINLAELIARYNRAKRKLNAIYGILCERLIKDEYVVDDNGDLKVNGSGFIKDQYSLDEISKVLDDIYGSYKDKSLGSCANGKCFNYIWGCYITAYAKQFLFEFCNAIGWDNVLYVDTDSAFYKTSDEIENRIAELNSKLRNEAINTNAYCSFEISKNGNKEIKTVYMHEFADEEEHITLFKSLNAKRYLYYGYDKDNKELFKLVCSTIIPGVGLHEDSDGKPVYELTREMELCGVQPGNNITYADVLRGFDNFKVGFKFYKCGGNIEMQTRHNEQLVDFGNGNIEVVTNGIAILATAKELDNKDISRMYDYYDDITDEDIDNLFINAGALKISDLQIITKLEDKL